MVNPISKIKTHVRRLRFLANRYELGLWFAHYFGRIGYNNFGLVLARQCVPNDKRYVLNILEANKYRRVGNEEKWLKHLNMYLKAFDAPAIFLADGEHILSRLSTRVLPPVFDDRKITVILPAKDGERTIQFAVTSILQQTWQNLELVIVDDASTDRTPEIIRQLAASDHRIKVIKNKKNLGPYVSKNIALIQATGDYITGQDADDWSQPRRLENHIKRIDESGGKVKASLTHMIRMNPEGVFNHIGRISGFSFDGVTRKALISCLFERDTLVNKLGFWDSVRFGADSEMVARAKKTLGDSFVEYREIGMLCLDWDGSLTNHTTFGVDKTTGLSPIRRRYKNAWQQWHRENLRSETAFLPFPQPHRRYDADESMIVNGAEIESD